MNRKLLPILILLTLALIVAACGGGEEKSQEEPTTPPTPVATETPRAQVLEPTPITELEEMTPEELGARTDVICREARQRVTESLKDRPPAVEVKAQIAGLKEAYVQQLVTLGHAREALGRQERAAADYAFQQAWIAGAQEGDGLDAYFGVLAYYKQDEDFYQLVNSFNALASYANFDRLRRELPAEAARLGVAEATEAEAATPTATLAESVSGDVIRNAAGGYSFRSIAGYVVQESGGTVIMDVDGGDPEYGPAVILIGGPNAGHDSAEALLDSLVEGADESQLTNRREINVGGVAGIAVDMKSQGGAVEVTSRVVAALGNADQQFTMFGFAPAEQWDELEPLFEQVLASVSFFEP